MLCPRCNIEMKFGQAIHPYELKDEFTHFVRVANKDNLRLVKCWKCPSCGKSEEFWEIEKIPCLIRSG